MKNVGVMQQDAIMECVVDLQDPFTDAGERCKVMVMSPLCFMALKKEDDERNPKPLLHPPLIVGSVASMWGVAYYVDVRSTSYEVIAYGGSCEELKEDYPGIWETATKLIEIM